MPLVKSDMFLLRFLGLEIDILPDQLVEIIPVRVELVPPYEGLPHECRKMRKLCSGHVLGGLARESTAEHGQLAQDTLFLVGEQVPGIIEDRPDRAVPLGYIPGGGGQEVQAALDFLCNLITS